MHHGESIFHVASELSILYPNIQYLKLKPVVSEIARSRWIQRRSSLRV